MAALVARGQALLRSARPRDADGGARLLEVLLRRLVLDGSYHLRLRSSAPAGEWCTICVVLSVSLGRPGTGHWLMPLVLGTFVA